MMIEGKYLRSVNILKLQVMRQTWNLLQTVIIKHSSIRYWRRSVCVCVLDIRFQMCSESKVVKINLRLPELPELPERWVGLFVGTS